MVSNIIVENNHKDLLVALSTSVKELQQGLDLHCCLITSLMEGKLAEPHLRTLMDRCPKRARERRLEKAVREAIDVLDESRKAFKSKALERLRKQLTEVLIDPD
ncbi:conserved hypothetical protein [uncultured Desulfatiglans sp.]|nr:conserved hypothetical protein [uncultured Desulfatiglans sp.]